MRVFLPGLTNAIVASAVSSFRQLPSGGDGAAFYNAGPDLAFVVTGDDGVVATLPALAGAAGAAGNATPIPVGASVPLDIKASHKYWAVITLGGAANVYCTSGDGI